jgi:hypothetical protein
MTKFIEELEERVELLKRCIKNGNADDHPDQEVIDLQQSELDAVRIALGALYREQ